MTVSYDRVLFDRSREYLFETFIRDVGYWIDHELHNGKCLIPLGTLNHPKSYSGDIPLCDVVTIEFDPVDETKSFTNRKLFNLLMLGGSGDGKSLRNKLIWFFLQKAGWRIVYFDCAKADEASRAKKAWLSPSGNSGTPVFPPFVSREGIPCDNFVHNFVSNIADIYYLRRFGTNLNDMIDTEYWMSLGMSRVGGSKVANIVKNYRNDPILTIDFLIREVMLLDKDETFSQTKMSILDRLTDCQENNLFKGKPINFANEWDTKNSIVISYNNIMKAHFMVFDIGFIIKKLSTFSLFNKSRIPIAMFFGDASIIAKKDIEHVKSNLAMNEIRNIGNNYRSAGLNGILEVQSVDLIDPSIAETFKTTIISPFYKNPDNLRKINVPSDVITILKEGEVDKNPNSHYHQWILIKPDNTWVRFYPFIPPSNHFVELLKNEEAAS